MTAKYRTAPYLYRMYDADGLIYIGSTNRFWKRLREHRQRSWWAETVVKVRAELCPTLADARQRERAAIRAEVPRWNLCDTRPLLPYMNEDEWDHFLRRFAVDQYRQQEWELRRYGHTWFQNGLLLEDTKARGLPWLLGRYRFQFGKPYDVTRLEQLINPADTEEAAA